MRVVDDERNELPPGEVEEFVTTGPQVVSGYWEKPEETAYKYLYQVEIIEKLPTTATGKILRRELRDQEAARARS